MKIILSLLMLATSLSVFGQVTYLLPGEDVVARRGERVVCEDRSRGRDGFRDDWRDREPLRPRNRWVCVYNFSDHRWGIHIARGQSQNIAEEKVLQSCFDHNGKRCKKSIIKCEETQRQNRYFCTYKHKDFGQFSAESRNRLEAETRALEECERTNKQNCNKRFVRCVD
jgi:hypothetical protein